MRKGSVIVLSEIFQSTAAPNSSDFHKFVEVDCRLLTIAGLQRPPIGGKPMVPQIPLKSGAVLPTPVLITFCRVLYVTVLFEAVSATIYCTTDNWNSCDSCTTPVMMRKDG